MSRVYDALRQWSHEHGTSLDFLSIKETPEVFSEEPAKDKLIWSRISEVIPRPEPEDRIVALSNGNDLGTEKFRLLQSRLRQLRVERKCEVVVLTSAIPSDGKSLIAVNLAMSLAKHTALKILLLEGDLHKPVISSRLGLPISKGFSDWLATDSAIEESLFHLKDTNLWLLPAGSHENNPLRLLQSGKFGETLSLLRGAFDWIIVDSPPLLPLADAGHWSEQADGVILVVRDGNTPRKLLQRALETIDTKKILGVVINDTQATEKSYYERYYRS
jgi:capsular exopolysaccharide synthesis family protein